MEFRRDPTWARAQVTRLSEQLGIDRLKVYKWGFNRKRKLNSAENTCI